MTSETKVFKPIRRNPTDAPALPKSEATRKAELEKLFRNLTQAKWPLSPGQLRLG